MNTQSSELIPSLVNINNENRIYLSDFSSSNLSGIVPSKTLMLLENNNHSLSKDNSLSNCSIQDDDHLLMNDKNGENNLEKKQRDRESLDSKLEKQTYVDNNDNKNVDNIQQKKKSNQSTLSINSPTTSDALSPQSALLPVTYDQINKNRFVFGSSAFYDSFFSQSELERFFPDHKIRLAVVTWNMGSKPPSDYNQSLQKLLYLKPYQPIQYDQPNLPELFIIGLQETPTSEVVVDNVKVGIQAVLGPNYVLLRWSSVGALHCSVWIRRELLWSCTTVETVPIHTRPVAANRIRTKGAIALSFCLFGTSFLFINTHLNAHEINLRARMNQLDKMQQILNLKYPPKSNSETNIVYDNYNNNNSNNKLVNSKHNIRDHHSECIFWFGDLNFRLELPIDIVLDAMKRIANSDNPVTKNTYLHKLMRSDQLSNLMNRGMIFNGFEEAQWPPPFLPTYKCKMKHLSVSLSVMDSHPVTTNLINHHKEPSTISALNDSPLHSNSPNEFSFSSTFDYSATSSNVNQNKNTQDYLIENAYNFESGRVPSYTDRILYQSKSAHMPSDQEDPDDQWIKCIYYNSISSLCSSDHKPVYGLFEAKLDGGRPNIPLSIKRLSQLVDEMCVKKLAEIDSAVIDNRDGPTIRNSNIGSDVGHGGNFYRLINRHRNIFNRKKLNIGTNNSSGYMGKSDLMKSDCSPNISSNHSLNKLRSKRLSQLNAGAYERNVYLDGLRLCNNLMQSISMEEIKSKKEKMEPSLFKSHSFESNVLSLKDEQKQSSERMNHIETSNNNNRTSSVCVIS